MSIWVFIRINIWPALHPPRKIPIALKDNVKDGFRAIPNREA